MIETITETSPCPYCVEENSSTSRYCGGCGSKLSVEEPPQAASEVVLATFEPTPVEAKQTIVAPAQNGTKACPYCGEAINEEAIKCRYCQSVLQDQGQAPTIALATAAPLTKECPYCAEDILLDAIKCVHCESTLPSSTKVATAAASIHAATPATAPPPATAPEKRPLPIDASTKFCTNCGDHVVNNAIACTSCGATPRPHKKYCYTCGTSLNPAQVICLSCGGTIGGSAPLGSKSKVPAGWLAIILGCFGLHKFYLGSWGWGIVYLLFFFSLIPSFVGIIEGICLLTMTDDRFNAKYNIDPPRPFKW